LPLALQFNVKLDLQAVEKEIDRQDTLSGGNSPDAALARFSMALTKKSQREVAEYIDKHREQLFRHLNPRFVNTPDTELLDIGFKPKRPDFGRLSRRHPHLHIGTPQPVNKHNVFVHNRTL
jgi:hypothetical protein